MTRCPRAFEVEAAHDGRLDAAARASIAQHQRDCPRCQAAANALAALGPALAMLPVPASDALAARRHRNRLLAAFEAAPAAPVPARRRRTALAALALAAVAAAAIVATRAALAVDPPAVRDAAAVTVAPTSARWSRYDQGGLTVVRLEDGELELHVAHGPGARRLIVSLPDGMLDDVGTTFQVSVAAGHTIAIAVRDGTVALRRAGRPPVFLVAGDRWRAEPAPPPVASAPPRPPAALPSPRPVPRPAAPAPRPVHDAIAAEFRGAVALLEDHRDAAAATALSGFLARHGDDPRAEDASYLRVLALQRLGEAGATAAAARAYLQRYPRGLRRAEVEALARGAP